MPIDQAQEQLNEMIKGIGGAICLLDNPSMQGGMLAGPEVVQMTEEFEDRFCKEKSQDNINHHEMMSSFQKKFKSDVAALAFIAAEIGNPFIGDTKELFTLDIKAVMDASAVAVLSKIRDAGTSQHHTF